MPKKSTDEKMKASVMEMMLRVPGMTTGKRPTRRVMPRSNSQPPAAPVLKVTPASPTAATISWTAPAAGDAVYTAVAAVVALAVGAFVFSRSDDRIAVEV